jgi:uncharacterized protein (DUF2252 family)
MSKTPSLKERFERGRALRKTTPRGSHEAIGATAAGASRRDPIALLKASSKGRVERLVPLRYGRMLASPFAFFRGTAMLQARDLAATPHTGLVQQINGDCHLMNFGGFATPERNLIFDLNDFDETHPGPWEWDVKRLAASFIVAARHLGFSARSGDEAVLAAMRSYQSHMAEYAEMGALDIWYDRIGFDRLLKAFDDDEARDRIKRGMAKAKRRTHEFLLPKIGHKVDGQWTLNDSPPGLFHIHGDSTLFGAEDDWMQLGNWRALSDKLYNEYLVTLSSSHKRLLDNFAMRDLAFKVVGVGSVGTRCLVLLMIDAQGHALFLQIKEARRSVLESYAPSGKSAFKHEGRRVVAGQRMMQASSDPFLGWSTGPSGRHFYFRQLRDMKVSPEIETYDEKLLGLYAGLCGWVLARGHARAGGSAPEISAYLGNGEQFSEALVNYANGYADQVQRDFDVFRSACRTGRLRAQTEADFSADIGL